MLTEKQQQAMAMLLQGSTVTGTAAAVGVHRCTVWRWTQTRDWQREWRKRYPAPKSLLRQQLIRSGYYKAVARRRNYVWRLRRKLDAAIKTGNKEAIERAFKRWEKAELEAADANSVDMLHAYLQDS